METIDLTHPAVPLSVAKEMGNRPAAEAHEEPAARSPIARAVFDGLPWTYRNGFNRVLERLPAAAWREPLKQGWEKIKQNGAREVWRANIGGTIYYLKYYALKSWLDRFKQFVRGPACQTEWKGGIYALNANIPAARPAGYTVKLHYGGRWCSLLVTEAIQPAYPLNEYWHMVQADDDAQRRRRDTAQLIERLAEMIARAHQAGFEHLDMHAANILVQPLAPRQYRTVFVDLHSARLGAPVSDRAAVRNLAQLNQWFRRESTLGDRLRFLRAYLRWRNEYEHAFVHARPLGLAFEELFRALIDAAERHARQLWAQRDRRARRSGRYFARLRLGGGWRGMAFASCKHKQDDSRVSNLTLDAGWWRQQLKNPLCWFAGENGTAEKHLSAKTPANADSAGGAAKAAELCKDSHSAKVARALLAHGAINLPVIVKRPLARNWRRRLSQLFGPSRSLRGWRLGHALLHRDLPTPRPLAFVERRFGPFTLDSVLLTEAVPGALDLETHLKREHAARAPRDWFRHKRELCEMLVRHVRRLQERGFWHRDCKAGNILVATQPRLKLFWIDMDGLRLVKRLSRAQQLTPLMRLHVSLLSVPGLTRADRLRFLKSYFARLGVAPDAWKSVWRELSATAAKKIAAKENRRAWKLAHYGRE